MLCQRTFLLQTAHTHEQCERSHISSCATGITRKVLSLQKFQEKVSERHFRACSLLKRHNMFHVPRITSTMQQRQRAKVNDPHLCSLFYGGCSCWLCPYIQIKVVCRLRVLTLASTETNVHSNMCTPCCETEYTHLRTTDLRVPISSKRSHQVLVPGQTRRFTHPRVAGCLPACPFRVLRLR